MKILFLDFDGVIRFHNKGFCTDRMARLAAICTHLEAQVVITSDHRNFGPAAQIQAHLHPRLFGCLHPDWATPICGHRWNEVQAWLTRHPEVTRYAILEDFPFHYSEAPEAMQKRILWCLPHTGLTTEHEPKIYQLLH